MLEFLGRLLQKRKAPPPGSLAEELWVAELSDQRRGRFLEARGEGHSARYANETLGLELLRPDLYAWTEAGLYRYADFVIEGELAFGPAEGRGDAVPHSACGFLFRYQDEANFYSVLVSNRGYFRLDAVFNGSPRPLIAWTEVPREDTRREDTRREDTLNESVSLRIIARGTQLTVMIDGRWAGEIVDETFREGFLAFAGQNYGEGQAVRFLLSSFFVESRPMEVETWYYRYNYYLLPEPDARRALAGTFLAMGENLAAAVQLRRIEKRRPLDADELFLKAEAALRLGLQDEAAEALDACIAAEPRRREALEEKANLLYLRGRALELRDWLEGLAGDPELGPGFAGNARLVGLSGHARFSLGDFEGAAAEYRRAAGLEVGETGAGRALMRMNEARAWEQAKRKEEAAEAYLDAARLFFRQEADDDLSLALGRLAALRPRSPELKELKAKTLFRQGKTEEAGKLLAELAKRGSTDSAVHYLLGIVHSGRGERDAAVASFARSCELEPGSALYAFRYAESLFLAGRGEGPGFDEALSKALELGPADGWTLNLAGQADLAAGRLGQARARLEAAKAALPAAPEPAMNLAELESLEGRLEAALAILAAFPDSAACRNQAGNAFSRAAQAVEAAGGDVAGDDSDGTSLREERLELAAKEYEAAARLDPGRAEYQENLAAAYLELERYSEAEERIRRALDLSERTDARGRPSPRACLLAGNLAMVYGERPRAEAAYRLGLESAPGEAALLAALGSCYLASREFRKAEDCVAELRGDGSRGAATERRRAAVGRIPSSAPGWQGLAAADREEAGRAAARLEAAILAASTDALSCAACGRTWRVPKDLPSQSAASIRAMPPDDSPAGACPECGKLYCIACRKEALVDSRFTCPDCGSALKLADHRLRWLVREAIRRGGAEAGSRA